MWSMICFSFLSALHFYLSLYMGTALDLTFCIRFVPGNTEGDMAFLRHNKLVKPFSCSAKWLLDNCTQWASLGKFLTYLVIVGFSSYCEQRSSINHFKDELYKTAKYTVEMYIWELFSKYLYSCPSTHKIYTALTEQPVWQPNAHLLQWKRTFRKILVNPCSGFCCSFTARVKCLCVCYFWT